MNDQVRESARHAGSILPTTEVEEAFWEEGWVRVAGLDEAGRGPWAGPVYAGAVILPHDAAKLAALRDVHVRDSKTLTPQQRERSFATICDAASAVGIGYADVDEIDTLGIVPATQLAMQRALKVLEVAPQALILDNLTLPLLRLPQKGFPRADATSLSVAAASIVAKVSRDRWMIETAETTFPGYGFAQHKGYGTPQHREALDRLGVCPLHRRSFRPIAERLAPPSDSAPLPGL